MSSGTESLDQDGLLRLDTDFQVIGSTSPTTVEAMAVAEALQGLRSLGDAPEVRAFLAAFTPKISEAKQLAPRPLVPEDRWRTLFGLQ